MRNIISSESLLFKTSAFSVEFNLRWHLFLNCHPFERWEEIAHGGMKEPSETGELAIFKETPRRGSLTPPSNLDKFQRARFLLFMSNFLITRKWIGKVELFCTINQDWVQRFELIDSFGNTAKISTTSFCKMICGLYGFINKETMFYFVHLVYFFIYTFRVDFFPSRTICDRHHKSKSWKIEYFVWNRITMTF